MQNDLIRKVASLMTEQSAAYSRLESAAQQLTVALVGGEPGRIESLTKAGETDLLRMRSRLLEITSALTNFAETRANQPEKTALDADAREQFDAAAKKLLENARSFQKIAGRATSLALGGSSFSTACIQMCGVPPMTYRAPVSRYG
ncbi:MAG: hypothetical protein LH614_07230 [Pyrinomonadaceae bacterium]|nr:hypothetical protein [Pyrinomonadaceae bacterium]